MTSTFLSKLTVLASIAVAAAGVGLIAAGEPNLSISTRFADIFRYIVMTQAGVFIGLLLLCAYTIARLKFDPADKLLRPMAQWAFGSSLLALYGLVSVASVLHSENLGFKTILLCLSLLIGDLAGIRTLYWIRRILKNAIRDGAVIKLTILDTHTPGPTDHDLDGGHPVV